MGISVRRQKVLPEGTPIDALIKDAEQVMGQFSPQIRIDLKVINGPHAGYEFSDYLKLHVDEETGEVFVKEGGKCWETIVASLGEAGADEFEEASELKGAEITARASLRGKARKYNGLEFGSIGPYIAPKKRKKNQEKIEQEVADDLPELSDKDEKAMEEALG